MTDQEKAAADRIAHQVDEILSSAVKEGGMSDTLALIAVMKVAMLRAVGSLGFHKGVFVISSMLSNVAKITDDNAMLPCTRPLGGPQGHPCTLRTPSSHRTHLALSP